ncbi:MAG: hypothetical protein QNJ63_31005 [Calothrix sp. MO_192.B10]|nr:hypothetical protein [Calothrix sp. MO_192.B10]
MAEWYKKDLAYIHDIGFRDYALKSIPGILQILNQNKIDEGLIVDLGCGSGLSAQELTEMNGIQAPPFKGGFLYLDFDVIIVFDTL